MTTCSLCGLAVTDADIRGETAETVYCCPGCRAIDESLESVAIEEESGGRIAHEWDGPTEFFEVTGMHCSTCELFLERVASDIDGVATADASFATETIRLGVDDGFDTNALTRRLSRWGYTLTRRGEKETDHQAPDGAVPRLLIGVIFGMMTMVWYLLGLYPTYFGYDSLIADLAGLDGRYLLANIWVMTTIVLLYTGGPLLRGAVVALRARQPSMDLLVSLAAVGAYAYSALAVVSGRTDVYFDITVAVVLVVTLGRYYEGRIRSTAAGLIGELTALRVDVAHRHPDGTAVELDAVDPGDRLIVRSGDRIPLDGHIIEGSAAIDESLLTGAVTPRHRGPGDPVAGGTVVTDEPLVIEVGRSRESALDRIIDRLWHIQSERPGIQQLATRLAIIFVPLVVVLATAATIGMLVLGASVRAAALVGLTVVIVSCPCALGLATPMAIASGVRAAATRGVVLTAASVIEIAPNATTVVFDKTGTLTGGHFRVTDVLGHPQTLSRAASIERRSNHPLATAIVEAAGDAVTGDVDRVRRLERGMLGVVDGTTTIVGDHRTIAERSIDCAASFEDAAREARERGQSPVYVAWDGQVNGLILLEDRPRPAWQAVIDDLAGDHSIVVLTGDDEAATERFRRSPSVDHVFAGVPPEAKAETIDRLRRSGPVVMIGDGTNDAPALAAADLGIALQSGTELAVDAADAVILGDDLEGIPALLDHARLMRSRVRQNLAWAFVYNSIAIPLAIVGILNPLLAAIAMAASSLLVVLNSARRYPIEHHRTQPGWWSIRSGSPSID